MAENKIKLSKSDRLQVWFRHQYLQGSWNYERMQHSGYLWIILPQLRKIYGDNTEALKTAARTQCAPFFNTSNFLNTIITGIDLALEETDGLDSLETVASLKTGLMGPLAGIGDSLLNGTARPILAGLAISFIQAGLGWFGVLFFVIGMSIVSLGVRYFGVFQGYKQGVKLVAKIQSSGLIDKISDLAAIAAYTIVGGFIPGLVIINIPIEIGSGDSVLNIQQTLDGLVPGLLGVLYTLLMYVLITKKKISAVKLILITMVIGIAGVYLGILG